MKKVYFVLFEFLINLMLIKCLKVLNWCIGKMYNLEKNIIHFSTSQRTMISEKTYKEREKQKENFNKNEKGLFENLK